MDSIVGYIKGILADSEGEPSSKRLIIILCTFLLALGYVSNLYWGFKVEQYMYDAVMWVVLGGAGMTGVEKFASSKK